MLGGRLLLRPPSASQRDQRAFASLLAPRGENLGPSRPDTVEHFLLERYELYSVRRGTSMRGQVHHAAYDARQATLHHAEESLAAAVGLPGLDGQPAFVHACDGVDVEVFAIEPVG
ncbi:MAG: DUF2071 domain-containing protein [Nannocystaceae bacterium]